jgi:hypothetical protein
MRGADHPGGDGTRLLLCPYCRTRLALTADGPSATACRRPARAATLTCSTSPMGASGAPVHGPGEGHSTAASSISTHLARPLPGLPVSLGLRAQVLKLRFATPGLPGRFLAPDRPEGAVLPAGEPLPPGAFRRIFLGDTASLFYAPYRCRRGLLYVRHPGSARLPFAR